MKLMKMDILKTIWIVAIILRSSAWSEVAKNQLDCRTIQCAPIQCPEDSLAVDAHFRPGFDDIANEDEDINLGVQQDLAADEEAAADAAIFEDEEIEDDNVVKIEHQNRRHVTSDHFYVEPSEKDQNQENRTLVKRSLQYKRRESIKIVPGDYKSLVPIDDRYHAYSHNHHKWRRETAEEVNATDSTTITPPTNECCPPQKCICKNSCDRPICSVSQVLILVKHGHHDQPGECCPLYQCIPEPDCKVNVTNTTWIEPCQICECLAGHKICHNTCGEEKETRNTCLSTILNQLFLDGQSWLEGECTHCECHDGERKCWTSLCKPLECRQKIKPPGECCPVCLEHNQITPTEENIDESMVPVEEYPTLQPETSSEEYLAVSSTPSTPLTSTIATRMSDSHEAKPPIKCISEESELDPQTIFLYAVLIVLFIACIVFAYLWYREKSKKFYGPVPSSESNLSHEPLPVLNPYGNMSKIEP